MTMVSAMRDVVFAASMTFEDLMSLRLEASDLPAGDYSVQSLAAFAAWKESGRDLAALPLGARTELQRYGDGSWSLAIYPGP